MIAWLEHPERVRDAREAAALVRELGSTRVRVTQHRARAWVIKDRAAIARVLGAVEPYAAADIVFEGITRDTTLPVLAALAASDAQAIFIAGTTATLRIWPRRGEAFVDELALGPGMAFERFRGACTDAWINGSVSEPGGAAVELLPRLVAELDQPEIEVDLDLDLDTALALALAFPGVELEWTAGAIVQLPAGVIATYRVEPVPDGFATEWQATIAGALARARGNRPPDGSP